MFKDVLKSLRKERKITQEQLAVILGVERSSIGKYESSPEGKEVIPSVDVLHKIADYFDVSLDYLLGRTDIKKAPTDSSRDDKSDVLREFVELYELLPLEKRKTMVAVMKSLLTDKD